MKIKFKNFSFKYSRGKIDCLWRIPKGEKGHFLWLCFSNKKHGERIWGKDSCQGKSHFCLIIHKVISLDTAHIGKKLWGRLYLTRLGSKDYHIYSSGEGVNECSC